MRQLLILVGVVLCLLVGCGTPCEGLLTDSEVDVLVAAVESGLITWEQVVELRQVVAGLARGRQSSQDIIYVKHFCIGVVDMAATRLAYVLTRQQGVGFEVDI